MDLAKKLQLDAPGLPAEPSSGDEALAKLFPAPPVAVAAPPRPFGMLEPWVEGGGLVRGLDICQDSGTLGGQSEHTGGGWLHL